MDEGLIPVAYELYRDEGYPFAPQNCSSRTASERSSSRAYRTAFSWLTLNSGEGLLVDEDVSAFDIDVVSHKTAHGAKNATAAIL